MIDNATKKLYLDAMGIQLWQRRGLDSAVPEPMPVSSPVSSPVSEKPQNESPVIAPDITGMDWSQLEQTVKTCVACSLHETRTQAVFGVGNSTARWVFVGEAPGAEEDRQGEPFVGRAGQLLNAMLAALGLKREDVYIANVLKCRPPNNRDPRPQEVEQCEPFLIRQIELINPSIIVALGRHAAHSLLKTDLALGKLRGQKHDYHGIPLIATYHPAYLLRTPEDKRKSWDDLRMAKAIVEAA